MISITNIDHLVEAINSKETFLSIHIPPETAVPLILRELLISCEGKGLTGRKIYESRVTLFYGDFSIIIDRGLLYDTLGNMDESDIIKINRLNKVILEIIF